jgi:serine/threonine-protein kinase
MANKDTVKLPPFKLPERFEFLGIRLEGGQGFVYVCRDKFLDRKVALKTPKSRVMVEPLRKELATLCQIKCRHVAEVYDALEAKRSELFAIVEEFVPGESLEQYVASTDIQKGDFLRIIYQLSCALTDIHGYGKVHRDATPRNLKFDAERVLKLLDFGLSSIADPDGITPHARGTPGFMGPEFYGPPPAHFSAAADIYSLGATAWFVASKGKLPAALLEDPPQSRTAAPSFNTAGMSLPPDIVSLLDATLLPDPNGRPEARQVRDTLRNHLIFGRHRATIHYLGNTYVLTEVGSGARIPAGPDTIAIQYDGLAFVVVAVTGDVYINNNPVSPGHILPDSCVITLGSPLLGAARKFVPVNMSHPEVVL